MKSKRMANSRGNKRHVNRTVKKHSKTSKRRPSRIGKRKSRSGGVLDMFSKKTQPINQDFEQFKNERLKWLNVTAAHARIKKIICALTILVYKPSIYRNENRDKYPVISAKYKLPLLMCGQRKLAEGLARGVGATVANLIPTTYVFVDEHVHFKTDYGQVKLIYHGNDLRNQAIFFYPKNSSSAINCISKYVDTYVYVFSHQAFYQISKLRKQCYVIIRLYHDHSDSKVGTFNILSGKLFYDYSIIDGGCNDLYANIQKTEGNYLNNTDISKLITKPSESTPTSEVVNQQQCYEFWGKSKEGENTIFNNYEGTDPTKYDLEADIKNYVFKSYNSDYNPYE